MAISADSQRYATRRCLAGRLKVAGNGVPVQSLNLNSFRWRSVKYWNQLPWQLRQLTNLEEFKRKLKIWVQENT